MAPQQYNSAEDVLLGRVIGEKFRLQSCVGIGSSGSVYQADQMALGRTVAIKVLRPDLAVDDRIVKRFHDEALAASRLNHPNTVSILDYGQTNDGLLYIVMEYLRGKTLTQLLESEYPLDPARIADLMSQVLSGLEEAHAAGVVHADLKADNVVVEHRRGGWDLAKVVDFGIARLVGAPRDETERSVCGTPEYMAPEIIAGADPTVASDLYAAGILLYEMLVGRTPFANGGGSSLEVLTRHLREAPVPPSARVESGGVNSTLEAAAMRAIAKQPSARFQSAESFRSAVNEALSPAPAEEKMICRGCGVVVARSFKFCPECGQARDRPPRQTREYSPHLTKQAIAAAADVGTADTIHGRSRSDTIETASDFDAPEITAEHLARGIFPLPLVGRERELDAVRSFLLGQTEQTVAQLVGAPGTGRSRLLREACADAAEADVSVYLATADPNGLKSPFYPVRSIVATVLDLPPICPYEGLGDAIEALGVTRRDLPGIAELFGHESELGQLEPAVRRRELLASTVRVLRAAGKRRSTVLVFEDADRYDPPSQELLRRLMENPDESALRVLITTDHGFADRLATGDRLAVGGMTEEALDEIARHLARAENDAMPTLDDLISKTDGTPTHVCQLIRYVIEGGSVDTAPIALADLIAARLELLPHEALRVLQVAAALGGESMSEQVAAVLPKMKPGDVTDALHLLDARALSELDGDVVWFSQDIVRNVVYESTPADVRRRLHARIFELFEASVGSPAVVGFHAERAGLLDRAAELLSEAGDDAVHQLDDMGACELYNHALACARTLMLADDEAHYRTMFVETSVKLAEALRVAGEVALARGIVEEARDHCGGAPALEAQLLRASGHLFLTEGDTESAIAMVRDGIGLAITTGKTELLTDLYLDLSTMCLRSGDPDRAIAELEEGINLVTLGEGPLAVPAPPILWRLLVRLAHMYSSLDEPRKARAMANATLAQSRRARSGVGAARAQSLLAELCEAAGQYDEAAAFRRAAVDQMRRLGDRRGTAELLLAGSSPTSTMMRIQASSLREARELAREIGWHEGLRRTDEGLH